MFKSRTFSLSMFVLLAVVSAPSQTHWFKYEGNPVMDVGSVAAFDSRAAAPTRVIFEDSVYKMWYSGWDGSAGFHGMRVGFATSADGISWTKHNGNPILNPDPSQWDSSVASHAYVIHTDSGYRMWYFGQEGNFRRLGYATSEDGIAWTKSTQNPILDVGPPDSWDERALIYPSVLGPDSVGGYRMWFYGFNAAFLQRIGYATSTDNVTWTKHPDNPIVKTGSAGSWDATHVGYPRVILDEGTYKMWYSGSTFQKIGYATSSDGITWAKWPQNPVFHAGPSGSWDDARVHAGEVLSDGNLFRMWYWGYDGTYFRTGYAVSPKGMNFSLSTADTVINSTEDTVRITVQVNDPTGLQFSAKIKAKSSGVEVDTVRLFDDGAHGDSLAADGVLSNTWIPKRLNEYSVDFMLTINDTLDFEMNDATSLVITHGVTVFDTVYTPPGYVDGNLTATMFVPETLNGNAVVLIHGLGGIPLNNKVWCDTLAAHGYIAMSIRYPGSDAVTLEKYPAKTRAAKTAVEFMRGFLDSLGFTGGKIAGWGMSLGAQTWGEAITWDNDDAYFGTDTLADDHLDAAVLLYGRYDRYDGTFWQDYFSNDPSKVAKGRCIGNIHRITTPVLFLHGTADAGNPVQEVQSVHDSLIAYGGDSQIQLFPDEPHGFDILIQDRVGYALTPAGLIAKDTVLAFLTRVLGSVSAVEIASSKLPTSYALGQNYPNPFNPSTKIGFKVQVSGFTSLKIFDLLGREVATLVNEEMKPGSYEVTWEAARMPSGVYFYRLAADGFIQTKKLMLIR